MPEVYGSVSNSFGIRSVTSQISAGQDAAKKAANNAINAVDDVLDGLQDTGGDALTDAVSAIEALGKFSPGAIAFGYQIPDYLTTTFAVPDPLSLDVSELPPFPDDLASDLATGLGIDLAVVNQLSSLVKGGTKPKTSQEISAIAGDLGITDEQASRVVREAEGFYGIKEVAPELSVPDAGSLDFEIQTQVPGAISTAKPTPLSVAQPSAPTGTSAFAPPTVPSIPDISVPSAPSISVPKPPALKEFVEPQLVEFVMPELTLPSVPTYTPLDIGKAPSMPDVVQNLFDPSSFRYDSTLNVAALRPALDFVRAIGPRLTQRELLSATLRWDGQELPPDVAAAQSSYRATMAGLANAGEQRRINIDTYYGQRELALAQSDGELKQWQQLFAANEIPLQKIEFEVSAMYANTYYSLLKSLTELYNARVATFNAQSAIYRASIESNAAILEKWKAEVDAEISKAKLNDQLAQIYAAKVQARLSKADLYEASVQTVNAQVEAYRARMEAFATQAEVARVKLGVYGGQVDAYVGSLAAYKSQFNIYEARVRGVAAENQLQESKTKVSMAEMQAIGADSTAKEIKLQVEAEKLKLETRKEAASFENLKLKNAIETVKAQIAGDIGRQGLMEYAANLQAGGIQNDAIAVEAQAAARYYNSASDAAYRASEQAFRAMMSAVQASNIAQDSASRSAASVAQGAYSAIHVNAGLQGSGRVTADESNDAKDNRSISDWLNYSESREQYLSA